MIFIIHHFVLSFGFQRVENALTLLLNVMEKSGNLRRDLREDIHSAVSDLRIYISSLKSELEEKQNMILEMLPQRKPK